MKLNEIIYNLKDSLGSDAEELTNAQYKFIIDYYRAKLVEQKLSKGQRLAPVFTPLISGIQLEETSDSDPGCSKMACNIYRTVKDIPSIIPYFDRTMLYIGSQDGYLPFQETSFQSLELEQYAKYISKQPKWFILGNKLYIVNPPDEDIEFIGLQGLFNDPIAAAALCEDNDVACVRNYDIDYPISGAMIDIIYKLIRDNELKGLIQEIDEDDNVAR